MRSIVRWALTALLAVALPIQAVAAFGMLHCAGDSLRHDTSVSHRVAQHEHGGVHSGRNHAHQHGDQLSPHDTALSPPHGGAPAAEMSTGDIGAADAHSDTTTSAHAGCSACASCAACGAVAAPPDTASAWMATSSGDQEPAASVPGASSFLTDGQDRPPRAFLA